MTRGIVEAWIGDARERSHLDDAQVEALLAGFDASGRGPDGPTATLVDGFLSRIHTAA